MLEDVVKRVEMRLETLGLSAAAASSAAGLSKDAIRNMQRAAASPTGRKGVSTSTITALAPILETTAGWLLSGEGDADNPVQLVRVPLAGRVGAGAQVEALEGRPATIGAPIAWSDATAFLVVGDSCYPTYEDGDFILVRGPRRLVPDECEGKMCVVETEDGRGLVKRVFDDGRGTFQLESPNAQPLRRIGLVAARPVKLRLDPTEVEAP